MTPTRPEPYNEDHIILSVYGYKQKFGRLQRELKEHHANCYKRQKVMMQLQHMIYAGRIE